MIQYFVLVIGFVSLTHGIPLCAPTSCTKCMKEKMCRFTIDFDGKGQCIEKRRTHEMEIALIVTDMEYCGKYEVADQDVAPQSHFEDPAQEGPVTSSVHEVTDHEVAPQSHLEGIRSFHGGAVASTIESKVFSDHTKIAASPSTFPSDADQTLIQDKTIVPVKIPLRTLPVRFKLTSPPPPSTAPTLLLQSINPVSRSTTSAPAFPSDADQTFIQDKTIVPVKIPLRTLPVRFKLTSPPPPSTAPTLLLQSINPVSRSTTSAPAFPSDADQTFIQDKTIATVKLPLHTLPARLKLTSLPHSSTASTLLRHTINPVSRSTLSSPAFPSDADPTFIQDETVEIPLRTPPPRFKLTSPPLPSTPPTLLLYTINPVSGPTSAAPELVETSLVKPIAIETDIVGSHASPHILTSKNRNNCPRETLLEKFQRSLCRNYELWTRMQKNDAKGAQMYNEWAKKHPMSIKKVACAQILNRRRNCKNT